MTASMRVRALEQPGFRKKIRRGRPRVMRKVLGSLKQRLDLRPFQLHSAALSVLDERSSGSLLAGLRD